MASQLATRVVDMGRRPCGLCLSTTKWVPVVFIAAVVCWSYYAYVVELCFYTISSYVEKVLYLLVYHVVLVMFVWAYYQTVMTPVRRVPPQFRLGSADFETFESTDDNQVQIQILENHVVKSSLPVYNRTVAGTFRFCDKCRHIKPDRCHHCSVCGECVLKMDHHCPWVNNCIGFSNYKFFILFLGYAFLYCVYVALTTLQYFIVFWRNGLEGTAKFHILFVFFVASMFGISLISLFGYHCYLVLRNQSTLETFRSPIFQSGPDKHGFHMGRFNNFCEVFGDSKQRWFLPVFTSFGDGVAFPMRYVPAVRGVGPVGYGATGSPTQLPNISLGDGVSYPQRHVDDDTDGLMGRQRWMEDDNDVDDTQIDTLRTLSSNGAHDSTASDSRPDVRINMG